MDKKFLSRPLGGLEKIKQICASDLGKHNCISKKSFFIKFK